MLSGGLGSSAGGSGGYPWPSLRDTLDSMEDSPGTAGGEGSAMGGCQSGDEDTPTSDDLEVTS